MLNRAHYMAKKVCGCCWI